MSRHLNLANVNQGKSPHTDKKKKKNSSSGHNYILVAAKLALSQLGNSVGHVGKATDWFFVWVNS